MSIRQEFNIRHYLEAIPMYKAVALTVAVLGLAFSSISAKAETFFLGTGMPSAMCVDVRGGGSDLILWNCHGGANQQVSFNGYGPLMMNGGCATSQGEGQPIAIQSCDPNKKSQRWAMRGGQINNEEGWCMDVRGQADRAGSSIIAWKCHGGINQKFQKGRMVSMSSLPPDVQQRVSAMNSQIASKGGSVVAMGGANVVAMGGANVVAMGGANVLAMGGGN
jgi:hypothetical protein